MKKKYWDLVSGIALLAFSVALFIASGKVKTLGVSSIGSGFFPSVVAIIMVVVSLAIIVGGVQKARGADTKPSGDRPRVAGVLGTFGLMAGYALLIAPVGFLITTTVYLFAQINILSPNAHRRQVLFAVISVITSVVIYFTFVKVFNLMLPAGILG